MKTIAHFVEKFPVPGNDYIYSQVLDNQDTKSLLIAEWLAKGKGTFGLHYFYRKEYPKPTFFNRLAARMNNGVLNGLHARKFESFARKILDENQVSVMHAHFGTQGCKLISLRKKTNIPLVVTFYGVDASYCLRHKYWKPRYLKLFEAADLLIVLCEEVKHRFLKLNCPSEKIKVWDIGIDLNKFPYQQRIPSAETKFLIVARFVEKKGYFVLLEAFKKALDSHCGNIKLTIIGYGPLKHKILVAIHQLGISDFVNFVDTAEISDFDSVFKEALVRHDIFVLPSIIAENGDDEGGPPIVITNAQASGLPVISTPVGGITRVIKDGETGFLTRPADAADLAEKMCFLIKNQGLWGPVSLRARSLMENNFSIKEQLRKLQQFYSAL